MHIQLLCILLTNIYVWQKNYQLLLTVLVKTNLIPLRMIRAVFTHWYETHMSVSMTVKPEFNIYNPLVFPINVLRFLMNYACLIVKFHSRLTPSFLGNFAQAKRTTVLWVYRRKWSSINLTNCGSLVLVVYVNIYGNMKVCFS